MRNHLHPQSSASFLEPATAAEKIATDSPNPLRINATMKRITRRGNTAAFMQLRSDFICYHSLIIMNVGNPIMINFEINLPFGDGKHSTHRKGDVADGLVMSMIGFTTLHDFDLLSIICMCTRCLR